MANTKPLVKTASAWNDVKQCQASASANSQEPLGLFSSVHFHMPIQSACSRADIFDFSPLCVLKCSGRLQRGMMVSSVKPAVPTHKNRF